MANFVFKIQWADKSAITLSDRGSSRLTTYHVIVVSGVHSILLYDDLQEKSTNEWSTGTIHWV